jgi:phytoene synthase
MSSWPEARKAAMPALLGQPWELKLRSLAGAARQAEVPCAQARPANQRWLQWAFAHCEAITAEHSRSFYWATAFLPRQKRQAIRVLYAICRISDDLVDRPGPGAAAELRQWRAKLLSPAADYGDPTLTAWNEVRRCYRIPRAYLEQLLDGVARDLQPPSLATFEDLAAYAYGVASTVGLMSLYILGCSGDEAVPYAIKLGVALQLTNILRDVGEDLRAGRVYLPTAELAWYGLTPQDLMAGQVDARWRAYMQFQISRNRQIYREAWPGIALLHRDVRLAVTAAGELYGAILNDIEAHDYDVFNHNAHVSTAAKLRRLPGIWWRSRQPWNASKS